MADAISKLQKWGNSQGIRIPKAILDTVQWTNDETIEIITSENTIVLKKIEPPHKRKNIRELFADYDDDYKPSEIDWGKKEGAEIW